MKKEKPGADFPSVEPRNLSKEELERIDAIEFSYPYDFAAIGGSLWQGKRERWSLSRLIADETFPFAALDLVDRMGIEAFDIDGFYSHLNLERIHLPGEISAVTACKTVKYCLEVLACEVSYTLHDGKEKQIKIEDVAADKAIRRVRRRAQEWQEGKIENRKVEDRINVYLHFVRATRHPFINRAVHNAAVNRWGASKDVQGNYLKWTPKKR